MSKVSFRARQIDFNKPLPILKHALDGLPDFSGSSLVNRGVPALPSGMEKEEENEHHFVEVINALQNRVSAEVRIPVPEISANPEFYKSLYCEYTPPTNLIHLRSLSPEDENPEYDMDSDDEEWLLGSDLGLSSRQFECMIDRLEHGCGQKVMNLEEAKCLLQDDSSLTIAVYDYWLTKRVATRQPLLYAIKQEGRDNSTNTDPYIAFRRRSEKMQTRKNRKNDEYSYEKMLILREQMQSLKSLFLAIEDREATKHEVLENEAEIFKLRTKMRDWDGSILQEAEALAQVSVDPNTSTVYAKNVDPIRRRTPRKRKLSRTFTSPLPPPAASNDSKSLAQTKEDQFAFIRLPGCRYARPRDLVNLSGMPNDIPQSYALTSAVRGHDANTSISSGYIRRRVGRGGGVICDRLALPKLYTDYLRSRDSLSQVGATDTIAEHVTQQRLGEYRRVLSDDCVQRLTPVILGSHNRLPTLVNGNILEPPQPFQPLAFPFDVRRNEFSSFSSTFSAVRYEERASPHRGDQGDSKELTNCVQPKILRPPRKEPHGGFTTTSSLVDRVPEDTLSSARKSIQSAPVRVTSPLRNFFKPEDSPSKVPHSVDVKPQPSTLSARSNLSSLLFLTSSDSLLSGAKKRCIGDSVQSSTQQIKSPNRVGSAPMCGLPI